MPKFQRKKVSLESRKTRCQVCGYPVSQRHHFLEVALYGETDSTIQLCANCHELYHLIYAGVVNGSKRRLELAKYILQSLHYDESIVNQLVASCLQIAEHEAKLGYIPAENATWEWFVKQLDWRGYIQRMKDEKAESMRRAREVIANIAKEYET